MPSADNHPEILFLAGDLSGDAHAARLARVLAERHPDLRIHALGGRKLGEVVTAHGGEWIADTTNCSAISLASVLKIYLWARWLQFKMRRFVRSRKIHLAVLCDWGGFNCRQLTFFQEAGVPVLYYFPPRSWQRSGTAGLQFAPKVTRVATPFDWSAARLAAVGCQADWVGHPLLETASQASSREALREEFGVQPGEKLIALLPGSRLSEIRVLCPRLAATAALLAREGPVRFVVPVPEPLVDKARSYLPPSCQILVGRATDALRACDAAVVKMGSATLEAAVIGAPQVAVYDVGWVARVEWVLLWAWKRIPFIAMPNIILQREIVPELLGLNCRPEAIAAGITSLLKDGETRQIMERGYEEIRRHLGGDLPLGATERTARIVEDMLGTPDSGARPAPEAAPSLA
jgi:lipid-A-disaccharide synthase